MTTLTEKQCRACGRGLPLSAFYRDASHSTGYQRSCKDCQKAGAQARHVARRPQALARMREYHQQDVALRPEHYRTRWAKVARDRRARLRTCDFREVTERDWERLVARHGGLCAYCGERGWEERDHVVPLARGGRHAIGNLLPACKPCNGSKGTRLLTEWTR